MAMDAPKDPWEKGQAKWLEKLQTRRDMLWKAMGCEHFNI